MNYDNPAARLLLILEAGKAIETTKNCRVTWDVLLKTDNNQPLLMSRLGKLMDLPHQIKQAIASDFPAHLKNTSHWEARVQKAFLSQNLNGDWGSFISVIDDHTISYLGLTAEILQTKANTKIIADEQLEDTKIKIQELYSEVSGKDLPSEIKIYLLRYLSKIIISIDEYHLSGAIPILESSETLLGHAFIDEKYRNFLRDEELGGRIFECLTAMANVVTIAVGLPQLSSAIKLLSA